MAEGYIEFPFGFIAPASACPNHVDKERDESVSVLCLRYLKNNQNDDLNKLRFSIIQKAMEYFLPWGGLDEWVRQNLQSGCLTPYGKQLLTYTVNYIVKDRKARQVDMTSWLYMLQNETIQDKLSNTKCCLNELIETEKHNLNLGKWLMKPTGFEDMVWFMLTVFGVDKDGEIASNFIKIHEPLI